MRKIIMDKDNIDTINFSQINENDPIFAKENDVLCGMVVHEIGSGWALRLGNDRHADGFHGSLQKCLSSCDRYGYEFYT